MKKLLLFILLIFVSCQKEQKYLTDYVNPFIGTGGHGHTYPGASAPFGMIQLSPDSRLEGWDGCGGYHYSDSIIYGFSHTHLSGTGVSDYGDILLIPTTGKLYLNNGANGNPGYSSTFSHENEKAKAGYYNVLLEDYNVFAELTASKRVGFHKYTFPENEESQVVLDLEHRDKLLDYKIELVDSNTLQGIRYSDNWAREQKVHFYLQFSKNLQSITFNEKQSVVGISFGKLQKPLLIKVGISAVSTEGAKANLQAEIPHWDFEKTKAQSKALWERELNKIIVEGKSETQKEIFYTALYHSLLNPNLYMDVDGHYNGTDLEKHHTDDKHYTIFSLWDTFRATHPLFTLIQQERTNEFIRTFLRQYKDGGQLPIWELAANYTGCMIGYHAIPVIVDAYAKGIRDYDTNLALEAMVHSAMQDDLGLSWYKKNGFIAASDEPESVSKNLEYAYDDWCIALLADSLGNEEIATTFYERGQYYKNLFDPSTGFFRAKKSHTWFAPFRPEEVNFNYTEANAWQYSLFVPQDISGHIKLMGGAKNYEQHLDNMFNASTETSGREQPDVTGLIGQYAHGNEPSHHMAYLYNYVGAPHKTQNIVRQILEGQYTHLPDGLSGNEDCGQMSAWYVLSAMSFYSVTPGLDYYTIGTPLFDKATINLENGNAFTILANNVSNENIYIQSATLNDELFENSFIKHATILNGGKLVFDMGSSPSSWASKSIPLSSITKNEIVAVPYFVAESQTFTDRLIVKLGSAVGGDIYYSINDDKEKIYETPIVITTDANISCHIKKEGEWSKQVSANYYKTDNTKSIKIESLYANQYAAAGDKTLIDHLRGGGNYRTGNWQGYREDLIATINLGKEKKISTISLGCMQDIKSWIFFPKKVEYFSSINGNNFTYLGTINTSFSDTLEGSFIQDYTLRLKNTKAKYIKVKAKNYGICPDWHLGAGGKTWLFVDELIIK
jgi:predicted alpha-1,2-mannosidase